MRYMIATDTGGTFTDVAVYDRETDLVTYGKRLTNYGDLIQRDLDELEALARRLAADGIESVAVSFVNSFVNPQHEEKAVELLTSRMPGAYVTCGTRLTREWFEYERTSTAVANAYVGSRMSSYVETFSA